jgi:hypothetical protein
MLPPGASLVEIDLVPRDGGTLVRFRHSGLPDTLWNLHDQRWSDYLAKLEASFRGGEND